MEPDVDGRLKRRLKCVPYESRFVDDDGEVDETKRVYKKDSEVGLHFGEWRKCLMRRILEAPVLVE